jgi:hypothetical protein
MCHRLFGIVLLTVLALFVLTGRAGGGAWGYRFSINGEPVTPEHYSLNGTPSVYAPGDVICVGEKEFDYGGLFMTLGEERDCRFVTASGGTDVAGGQGGRGQRRTRGSRVFLELPDGRRKIVGLKVSWTVIRRDEEASDKSAGVKRRPSFERTSYNPLDSLSAEEIHGLWGIALVQWPEGIEQQLAHVDTERVCLSVHEGAGPGGRPGALWGGPVFPPIPPKTRYLVVRKTSSPGLRDLSPLGQLRDLVFLKCRWVTRGPVDAGLICQNTSLRWLDLSGCEVGNYPKLASLTELRCLNLGRCRDVKNIDFVRDMDQLRTLVVGRTQVSSLTPLDDSDSIRDIDAGMSAVRVLPKGDLASLKSMHLMSTRVDAEAVEAFRRAHPNCRVQYGWMDSLRKAVRGTTRLRVRSGGTCGRRIEEEKTLAEITEPEEVERFLDAIDVDEDRSGGHCMCCGNPTFELYAGDRLLAMIGYHHGERLRWAGGEWTGDGELTAASRSLLVSWLSQHGVEGPQREMERKQKRQEEEAKKQRRYAEIIPAQTLKAAQEARHTRTISWRDDTLGEKRRKLEAEAFIKHEEDAASSAELYLRILGVRSDGPWNHYHIYDRVVVDHLLPRFEGLALAEAATAVMEDAEGKLGAARWLLGKDGWRHLDESDRERIVRPLAQQALHHRHMDTRKKVMTVLSEMNTAWAAALLRGVLSEPVDPNWSPPETKPRYGRRINIPGGEAVYADECSDAVWAAFCLAKMGSGESVAAIERLAEASQERDRDLLDKALLLLRQNAEKTP